MLRGQIRSDVLLAPCCRFGRGALLEFFDRTRFHPSDPLLITVVQLGTLIEAAEELGSAVPTARRVLAARLEGCSDYRSHASTPSNVKEG